MNKLKYENLTEYVEYINLYEDLFKYYKEAIKMEKQIVKIINDVVSGGYIYFEIDSRRNKEIIKKIFDENVTCYIKNLMLNSPINKFIKSENYTTVHISAGDRNKTPIFLVCLTCP